MDSHPRLIIQGEKMHPLEKKLLQLNKIDAPIANMQIDERFENLTLAY